MTESKKESKRPLPTEANQGRLLPPGGRLNRKKEKREPPDQGKKSHGKGRGEKKKTPSGNRKKTSGLGKKVNSAREKVNPPGTKNETFKPKKRNRFSQRRGVLGHNPQEVKPEIVVEETTQKNIKPSSHSGKKRTATG